VAAKSYDSTSAGMAPGDRMPKGVPDQRLAIGVATLAAVVAVVALVAWLALSPESRLAPRTPSPEEAVRLDRAPRVGRGFTPVNAAGTLDRIDPGAPDLAGEWPQLGGARRDGVAHGGPRLASRWPAEGPPRLWEVELGEGYAGPAVSGGRVFVLDHDAAAGLDAVRALSLADGHDLWRYAYPVPLKRNHGLSRTVPAVAEGRVVTLGPMGHVTCLDARTGELRWAVDLVRQYGTRIPDWYAGQCPLVDRGRVILAPAGDETLLTGLELGSGAVAWATPNPDRWDMTHSSVVPATLLGRRIYLYAGMRGVVGVSADDGAVMWKDTSLEAVMARIAMPVAAGDDRVLLCSGYGVGCVLVRLREDGAVLRSETVATLPEAAFGAEMHTPVFHEGHLYGVRPDGQLACLDGDGRVLWTSGRERRFYKGSGDWIVADGKILVMDPGPPSEPAARLVLVEETPQGYRQLAEARVLAGPDAWAPMALAGDRLLVRDFTRMACLDVGVR